MPDYTPPRRETDERPRDVVQEPPRETITQEPSERSDAPPRDDLTGIHGDAIRPTPAGREAPAGQKEEERNA